MTTLLCVLVLSPAADAAYWRGSGDGLEVALEIRHGVARGEMAAVFGGAPPFVGRELAASPFAHGRLNVDELHPSERGPEGYRVVLRRDGSRIRGRVTLGSLGRSTTQNVVLRRRATPIRGGYWSGSTDQQTRVHLWVSPFGVYMERASVAEDLIAPTLIADCGPGADRMAARPWSVNLLLSPNGNFNVPGDTSTGTFAGRLQGTHASGTARYTPPGCDSGLVRWSASRSKHQ